MKDSPKRFESIRRIADKRQQDAAAQFGRERRERDDASQRLEELQQYHREYMQRYAEATRNGAAATRLRDYQVFIDKLEYAIEEQQRILGQHQEQCAQAKREWSDKYTHSRAIGNVIERKRRDAEQAKARQEQKTLDDRAPRKG